MSHKHKTYLALGDSYTIGEGVLSADNFPNIISQEKKLDLTIVATTAWKTNDLLNKISTITLAKYYDYCSIMIGANNQYQGKSLVAFEQDLKQLIALGLEKTQEKNKLFVLSIPNYGSTPFGKNWSGYIASDISKYNAIIQKIALESEIKYIEITTISELASKDLSLLAADLLHPSKKMYQLWAEKIIKEFV